eukprot:COSAG01_NODE_5318_length_4337_cov_11.889571_6_plen_80_part_00
MSCRPLLPPSRQVVLCVGLGNSDEHEGHDRSDTRLPGAQEQFAEAILALGKPTVLVLVRCGGVRAVQLARTADRPEIYY